MKKTIDIIIVDFNTADLSNALIKSIHKNLKSFDYKITVFDNSQLHKFSTDDTTINVVDGTQLIDFKEVVKNNTIGFSTPNNYGTLKHSYTIDYLIWKFGLDEFVLFDSDTVLKTDIDFIDNSFTTIAAISHEYPRYPDRFYPFIQYFNAKKIRENNIHYFDGKRTMFGLDAHNAFIYDSGTSFLEDLVAKELPYKEIDYRKYIEHLQNGSWTKTNKEAFINNCKKYYQ